MEKRVRARREGAHHRIRESLLLRGEDITEILHSSGILTKEVREGRRRQEKMDGGIERGKERERERERRYVRKRKEAPRRGRRVLGRKCNSVPKCPIAWNG